MDKMRNNPPKEISGLKVLSVGDYQTQIIHNNITGEEENTNLPKSNVLYYELENNAWCCIRPSGTEPKIKFYIGVCTNSIEEANVELKKIEDDMRILAQI